MTPLRFPLPAFDCSRLALAATALGTASLASAAGEPNILWLIAEDFGKHLGAYGTAQVNTPNLDALAEDGMLFHQMFTTAPVCSPSRSAFSTGMYQTSIGAHHHRMRDNSALKPLPSGVRLISQRLRDAGYYTGNIGTFPAHFGFSRGGKTDWNFSTSGTTFDTKVWNDLKNNQPFYAQINFRETHRESEGYFDPANPEFANPNLIDLPPYYPDHPTAREDWAEYLDSATELDRKIGLVLAQLETDGLADNTIVVFLGDNGQAHARGKQFPYDSGLGVPFIVYVPQALQPMAGYEPGTESFELLEAIDLTATSLAWAGIAKPPGMHGRIFMGPNAEEPRTLTFGARDRMDETTLRMRTVRSDQYRYIRNFTPERPKMLFNSYKSDYPMWNLLLSLAAADQLNEIQKFFTLPTSPWEELYDVQADPHETINLANSSDPAIQAVKEELRTALFNWMVETGDANPITEPTTVLENTGEDWWDSPQMGTFSSWHYPYLYFPEGDRWGFQATVEDPMIGRWVHVEGMGWLWAIPGDEPYFYQMKPTKRFLYCPNFDAAEPTFYRWVSGAWQPL